MFPTLPYIQDFAGSVEHCPVATYPATERRDMRAVLWIVKDKEQNITELHLVGLRRQKGYRVEHEVIYSSAGEHELVHIYDRNNHPIERICLSKNNRAYDREDIQSVIDLRLRYHDTYKDGLLVGRKYVTYCFPLREAFTSQEEPQRICLERWDELNPTYEKYMEWYDDRRRIVSQSYMISQESNPSLIERQEMYTHFYDDKSNICTTYAWLHGHPSGWRVARYKYRDFSRGHWTHAEIRAEIGTEESNELLSKEVERKFAYSEEAEYDLLKEYEVLKTFVPQEGTPWERRRRLSEIYDEYGNRIHTHL